MVDRTCRRSGDPFAVRKSAQRLLQRDRVAHRAGCPAGVRTVLYGGLAALPHFNPDDDAEPLPEPVVALRAAIDEADAVLVCTPEYAGTLPGVFGDRAYVDAVAALRSDGPSHGWDSWSDAGSGEVGESVCCQGGPGGVGDPDV
ncbi:NADPH-dependent FMN reductase [Streptomyces atratus]|uniref:NADPH-dependent FMN reductase n=1 Tax=Streptomyces atratus TaxID=1893 RepID=UPI0016715F8B